MEASEIIKILGITSLPGVLFIFLIILFGKRFIELFFSKVIEMKKIEYAKLLENHKQDLIQENYKVKLNIDKNLEEYKSKLEQLTLEYNIKLSHLYSKRFDSISQIYKTLVFFQNSILSMTGNKSVSPGDPIENRNKVLDASKAIDEFLDVYLPNKIFLPKEITDKIDQSITTISKYKREYLFNMSEASSNKVSDGDFQRAFKNLIEISRKLEEDIPNSLKEIEFEFRKILGIYSLQKE
jgi:hypothetical protein